MVSPRSALAPALSVFSMSILACGPGADANRDGVVDGVRAVGSVTAVAPSTPVGSVSGQVVTSRFTPVPNGAVTLLVGGRSDGTGLTLKTTTDSEGSFAFKNVPAGATAQIIANAPGSSTVRTEVQVPGSAGQFPLNDGNANAGLLVLLELTGTVRFNVLTATGRPAKGVRGLLEVTPAGFRSTGAGTYGTSSGVLSFDATADELGILSFANVPPPAELARVSGSCSLTLSALDEDGDGRIDSHGTSRQYTGTTLFTQGTPTVVLPDGRQTGPLAVLASNLDALAGGSPAPLRNFVRPTESISVAFNQAVIEATTVAQVVGEDCSPSGLLATTKVLRGGTVLVISPPTTGWQSGREYNLAIRVTGLDSGALLAKSAFFFGADPGAPIPLGQGAAFQFRKAPGQTNTGVFQPGDELYVVFDAPIRHVGGPQARTFFNFDLNGSGSIGSGTTDVAEYGSPFATGFSLAPAEWVSSPNGPFSCAASGYTTRFLVSYGAIPTAGVPVNTEVKVTFPRDASTTDGTQTIWGMAFVGDVSGRLSHLP